ncbi:MAG: methyltransferase domain-containing protein [Actinobacteria bacterium]|jgi:predicted O-methyltransferase YrrM|uniref:Unannotated protein n=1 Tax=freshwater metagenome TaxID=449393 RepID=A0A6J7KZ82_9ZZZZ|nr:methyltransferase domain-containing protein [Actinomycetota bacterium]
MSDYTAGDDSLDFRSIGPVSPATWAYAEGWLFDSEEVQEARLLAREVGITPVSHATASLLTLLATLVGAGAIVEIGTGTGVSGAALLHGMAPDGVLTSIDLEAEHQRSARDTFAALGYDHVRARLITGRALEVLPRLSDQAYDIVFVDGDKGEYPAILAQAGRLLRVGGLVIFDQVLADAGIADPLRHDTDLTALRHVARSLRDEDHWMPALLTVGRGLLVASLRRPISEVVVAT